MLTCITCSKQKMEDDEDDGEDAPRKKDPVKSLTTQMKDMALKASGSSHGKPPRTPGSYKKGQKSYPHFETLSGVMQPGSSSSTPAWDFTNRSHHTTRPSSQFDRRDSGLGPDDVVLDEEDHKEWTAQVEPGVQITFASLPSGGNDLKRIRFSREIFDKWQAQRWWGENFDRIMELYNVQKFNQQVANTPGRSEDGRDSAYSRLESARESPRMTSASNRESVSQYGGQRGEASYMESSRMTTSSSVSISNASEIEAEWIEEDEPGVYITIRQLVDGTRELRRVRFSREKFGEVHAKHWWETNRDRIQNQYLS
ncbi:protein Brevis radix-like 1 [Andrographis paniculata]|uniref:protein Brevis radix-like 1 n=1 Tax=Andrographis paniculata TaxID=175694 RepID=UPI0021E6F35C|nr:protein Brevis radix-like 1 [Andrographis paniculata]